VKAFAVVATLCLILPAGCGGNAGKNQAKHTPEWQSALKEMLPLLGHRNWILVVDKAFPAQNADGITTIYTDADLLEVLTFTLGQIDSSTHVRPVIYSDRELQHITPDQVADIEAFRGSLAAALGGVTPRAILHDSVFVEIDRAAKLFTILVLKTNGTIPYSSVFIQLDCKYWSGENEAALRKSMK
jgi:hypothetical protein